MGRKRKAGELSQESNGHRENGPGDSKKVHKASKQKQKQKQKHNGGENEAKSKHGLVGPLPPKVRVQVSLTLR
jgi:hypothetical protein